jgi:hypothetical protein
MISANGLGNNDLIICFYEKETPFATFVIVRHSESQLESMESKL